MPVSVHDLIATSVTSVVVATDDTAEAEAVLRTAGAIVHATGARLHVVHGQATRRRRQAVPPDAELDRLVAVCLPPSVEPASRMVTEAPKSALVHAAREHWADLIVLGPKYARTELRRTPAERVLCESACACLIASGDLALPLRRVLVALALRTDDPGVLHEAIRWSMTLGDEAGGTEVVALHVLPADDGDEQERRQRMEHLLSASLRGMGAPDWISTTHATVRSASVEPAIVEESQRLDVDLIIVGKRTHGGIARGMIGSVALGVAARAQRPVLLLPPELCFRSAVGGTPTRNTPAPHSAPLDR